MKLYEIPDMIQQFLDAYDAGDVPEEAFDDTLESLAGDFAQKLDDCACAYKGLLAEAKEIKAEADALAARYKAKKAQADRMVAYMDKQLKRAAGLGVGADIYWQADSTKYTTDAAPAQQQAKAKKPVCAKCGRPLQGLQFKNGQTITLEQAQIKFDGLCYSCWKKQQAAQKEAQA